MFVGYSPEVGSRFILIETGNQVNFRNSRGKYKTRAQQTFSANLKMDKTERVLAMGYLIKSPAKSRDKANLASFWKRRWCVFSEIYFPGNSERMKKLVLHYFKDRDSYFEDDAAKGLQ